MTEVSMRCHCGTHAEVDVTASPKAATGWSCKCPRCYDPTSQSPDEDPSAMATCLGYGATPEQAISAWWEMVEQAWKIDYSPVTIFVELEQQIAAERRRTASWALRDGFVRPSDQWWGPSLAQMAGEP